MTLEDLDGAFDDDLRDARVLAWLLDSSGSHGAGHSAAAGFGTVLAERGAPGLAQALTRIPPPACTTTVRLRQGEVEVLARVADVELLIAWRSTPVGYEGALERAMADGAVAVGVAPSVGVFPEETGFMVPILLWRDVARALASVEPAQHPSLVLALRSRLSTPTGAR